MPELSNHQVLVWPVAVYGVLVVLLVAAIVIISYLVGQRHKSPNRDVPYESGIEPTGKANVLYGSSYYLIAVFYLVFDVEAAIILGWVIAFRELGWQGYAVAMLFIFTLVLGLVYIWKLGALDWNPVSKPEPKADGGLNE
jgi:NADH-quinone oxidoreductase subunit A